MLRSIYVSVLSQIWSFYSLFVLLRFWQFFISQSLLSTLPCFPWGNHHQILLMVYQRYVTCFTSCTKLVQTPFPFLCYNISVPTYHGQFAGDSNTCEQWHSHSDPVIAAFWTALLHLKVASRAMQLQKELAHCSVPPSSLCSCLSPTPQLPSPWDVTSWCSFSKEWLNLVCATPGMSYTTWHISTAHLGQCLSVNAASFKLSEVNWSDQKSS